MKIDTALIVNKINDILFDFKKKHGEPPKYLLLDAASYYALMSAYNEHPARFSSVSIEGGDFYMGAQIFISRTESNFIKAIGELWKQLF